MLKTRDCGKCAASLTSPIPLQPEKWMVCLAGLLDRFIGQPYIFRATRARIQFRARGCTQESTSFLSVCDRMVISLYRRKEQPV